jgi:hypothetical protein
LVCFGVCRGLAQKYSETILRPRYGIAALIDEITTKLPHILVVEDDREICTLIARYLRANDYRVPRRPTRRT